MDERLYFSPEIKKILWNSPHASVGFFKIKKIDKKKQLNQFWFVELKSKLLSNA